jgi:hypothetical protein
VIHLGIQANEAMEMKLQLYKAEPERSVDSVEEAEMDVREWLVKAGEVQRRGVPLDQELAETVVPETCR